MLKWNRILGMASSITSVRRSNIRVFSGKARIADYTPDIRHEGTVHKITCRPTTVAFGSLCSRHYRAWGTFEGLTRSTLSRLTSDSPCCGQVVEPDPRWKRGLWMIEGSVTW